jgi:hypothetical protein
MFRRSGVQRGHRPTVCSYATRASSCCPAASSASPFPASAWQQVLVVCSSAHASSAADWNEARAPAASPCPSCSLPRSIRRWAHAARTRDATTTVSRFTGAILGAVGGFGDPFAIPQTRVGHEARPRTALEKKGDHVKSVLMSIVSIALCCGCGEAPETEELASALNGPITCTFQTSNGHYLTAVGGGGRTTDVLHTDATRVGSWERFTLVDSGDGAPNIHYGVLTTNGHYLTAVGGGGRTTDVMHSDAPWLLDWEKLTMISLGLGVYAIQTIDGHYLTAVGAGGRITDTIHSDATRIGSWEKFRLSCTNP